MKYIFIFFFLCYNTFVFSSDIIDIKGFNYGRLNIALDLSEEAEKSMFLVRELKKNLLWSGLFDLHEFSETSDLILEIWKKPGEENIFLSKLETQENILIFSEELLKKDHFEDQEKEIIRFVKKLVAEITGQSSVLETPILYTEQKLGEKKQIVLLNTHGKQRKVVIKNDQINILPRWDPEKAGFIYTSLTKFGSGIYHFDFETNITKPIALYKGISSGGSWGKNQKQLMITISNEGNSDIYRINSKGIILEKMTQRSSIDTSPAWSPDGKFVLFVSNRSGSVQIYKLELESKTISRVTFQGKYNTNPRWSKDGKYIVYSGMVHKKFQVFVMNKQGTWIQQVTHGDFSSEDPDWSPDGRQIIYTTKLGNDSKLFMMNLDGSYKRRLTNSPPGVQEANPSWSGDFNWNLVNNH